MSEDTSVIQPFAGQSSSADGCDPNLGNPVFSCQKEIVLKTPTTIDQHSTHEPMAKLEHSMYVTTSSTYGQLQPSVETTPISFHGRSQKFSEHLCQSEMYRNHSLNTARDHSRV